MPEWVDVMALADLQEPGAKGCRVDGIPGVPFFVVRKDGQVHAYRNRCPHTGAPLEWMPDEFLDLDKSFIECALHGALFRTDNGYCLRGPCAGQSLSALEVRQVDGRLEVDVAPLREAEAEAMPSA
jgi:nitrite reductase/ring-hydroxylating ferredoxin subunit